MVTAKSLGIILGLFGSIGGITVAIGHSVGWFNLENSSKTKEIKTSTTKTVDALLKTNKKEILKRTEDTKASWNKNWEVFKNDYASLKEDWKLMELETPITNIQEAPDKFKDRCEVNGKKEVVDTNATLYVEVLKYCVNNS